MSQTVAFDAPSEPLSLYLELAEGTRADLEVVSASAIAMVHALREVAFVIDPSLQITTYVESGTRGSFSLNALLKVVKSAHPTKITSKVIIVTLCCWFAADFRQWADGKIFDMIYDIIHSHNEDKSLSPGEINQIAKKVEEMLRGRVAQPHVQRMFGNLQRDHGILGAGAVIGDTRKPKIITPRSEFPYRAGERRPEEQTKENQTRIRHFIREVYLISPVLLNKKRIWTFKDTRGVFKATIEDQTFLNNMDQGSINLKLKTGVHMMVEMEIDEENKDGIWTIKKRRVIKVLQVNNTNDGQIGLFSQEQASDDK